MGYLAYIFKALGVTLAWGLCGMHPGCSGVRLKVVPFLFQWRGVSWAPSLDQPLLRTLHYPKDIKSIYISYIR